MPQQKATPPASSSIGAARCSGNRGIGDPEVGVVLAPGRADSVTGALEEHLVQVQQERGADQLALRRHDLRVEGQRTDAALRAAVAAQGIVATRAAR